MSSVNILSRSGHHLPLILMLKVTNMNCVTCYSFFIYLEQEGELISTGNSLFILILEYSTFETALAIREAANYLTKSNQTFLYCKLLILCISLIYVHSFLKKLYSNSQECPRSYDKLRFNPRYVSVPWIICLSKSFVCHILMRWCYALFDLDEAATLFVLP